VTFEPHPLTVLRPEAAPPRLTPPPLKRELLAAAGVEFVVELPPSADVLDLSAEQFWALLRDQVRPAHLIEGPSFNFGKDRGGDVRKLAAWAAEAGVALHVVEPVSVPLVDMQVVPVSSSLVRFLLAHGRVRDAAICLGRPYALVGTVVKGFQRGKTLGVPTANLDCRAQMVPGDGVYAGRCAVDGKTYPAAVSIGTLPTFGETRRQVEAHLIGFDGDLYGRTLRVELVDWLRDQRKFAGIDALKARIALDLRETTERRALVPERQTATDDQ
jgi:riboflavin kinase / FMN adenylyltransferase